MKRLIFVIPLLGISAFASYYHYWTRTWPLEGETRPRPSNTCLYEEYRHRDGRRDAENDLANGKPRILTYGLPVHWIREHGELLQRGYGVELETVAGCVVSEELVDYVEAYNKTIEGHLASVHGPDLFDKLHTQAKNLFDERHPSSRH